MRINWDILKFIFKKWAMAKISFFAHFFSKMKGSVFWAFLRVRIEIPTLPRLLKLIPLSVIPAICMFFFSYFSPLGGTNNKKNMQIGNREGRKTEREKNNKTTALQHCSMTKNRSANRKSVIFTEKNVQKRCF